MMEATARPEAVDSPDDSLASLEDRIHRIVEVVDRLRGERDAALSELNAARNTAASSVSEVQKLRQEVDALRTERKLVRARIEKLLSQVETLSGS
jgi:uncharacterized coiled-coil DUF342 family protein